VDQLHRGELTPVAPGRRELPEHGRRSRRPGQKPLPSGRGFCLTDVPLRDSDSIHLFDHIETFFADEFALEIDGAQITAAQSANVHRSVRIIPELFGRFLLISVHGFLPFTIPNDK
jgi:hypothetical protein